ncbi:MAG: 30S ribosomal protein S21 [Patescibacteria group bacterium]|nr:30S ribosomal protein S21 [Patescibacteria group bacterium]
MINAEVQKNDGESTLNLIRRFSRRVQGAGLIQQVRGRRYYSRSQSPKVRQKHTLQAIKRKEEIQELIKLGKMPEQAPRRGARR